MLRKDLRMDESTAHELLDAIMQHCCGVTRCSLDDYLLAEDCLEQAAGQRASKRRKTAHASGLPGERSGSGSPAKGKWVEEHKQAYEAKGKERFKCQWS